MGTKDITRYKKIKSPQGLQNVIKVNMIIAIGASRKIITANEIAF